MFCIKEGQSSWCVRRTALEEANVRHLVLKHSFPLQTLLSFSRPFLFQWYHWVNVWQEFCPLDTEGVSGVIISTVISSVSSKQARAAAPPPAPLRSAAALSIVSMTTTRRTTAARDAGMFSGETPVEEEHVEHTGWERDQKHHPGDRADMSEQRTESVGDTHRVHGEWLKTSEDDEWWRSAQYMVKLCVCSGQSCGSGPQEPFQCGQDSDETRCAETHRGKHSSIYLSIKGWENNNLK